MLNCIAKSQAKKTEGIAVTYRAASGDVFGTCPDSCALKPVQTGTVKIDRCYERAVRRAVPPGGSAFLFSHFSDWREKNGPGLTVFNRSCDSLEEAADATAAGVASVAVVPSDYWKDKKSPKVLSQKSVKGVRCPDELSGIGCVGCGNGKPLCARYDRHYFIVFTAHGSGKKAASDSSKSGGCYAAFHWVRKTWDVLSQRKPAIESDGRVVRRFALSLPVGTILRHHIGGDLGRFLAGAK